MGLFDWYHWTLLAEYILLILHSSQKTVSGSIDFGLLILIIGKYFEFSLSEITDT